MIDFEAYDLETKKIYKVETIFFADEYCILTDGLLSGGKTLKRKLSEVCLRQFTGLLDKAGKKIFSGDIVTIEEEEGDYKVLFYKGAYIFKSWQEINGIGFIDREDIKVVGNIHIIKK